MIRERFAFYSTGWTGSAATADASLRSDLAKVVALALSRQDGVEGGIWQTEAGRRPPPGGPGAPAPPAAQ